MPCHNRRILYTFCLLLSLLCRTVVCSSAAGQETLIGIVGRDFILLGADSSVSQSIALTASNLDKIAVLVDAKTPQTPILVAAAAGNAADADRLLGELAAVAALREYEASVGMDVEFVDLKRRSGIATTAGEDDGESFVSTVTTAENIPPATPIGLSVHACAQLARGRIATSLRSRTPLQVCLLIAGMTAVADEQDGDDDDLVSTTASASSSLYASKQVQMQVQASARSVMGNSISSAEEEEDPDRSSFSSITSDEQDQQRLSLHPRLYWLDEYGSLQRVPYGVHGYASNFVWSILDQGYRPNMTRQQAQKLMEECFAQLRTRYVINTPQPPCIKCIDADGCRMV